MDSLLSLRVLGAVADLKSFAAAAEKLGLSPAMATKHVQHVEARLGARLLNRTSRNVSLTEAGAVYLSRMRPLLEGLDEAEAQIAQTAVTPSGRLRVSAPVWMANPAFAALMARYHERYPDVAVELDLNARMVNLVEDGFDLAIRASSSLEPGLVARKLGEVHFRIVASRAFLEKRGRPGTIAELEGAPFLAYTQISNEGRVPFRTDEGEVEVRLRPVLLSGNESLLMFAAREGMGYAILPHWLVDDELASGELEQVLAGVARPRAPLYAVYPDRNYLPAKVRSFLDFLVESNFPQSQKP